MQNIKYYKHSWHKELYKIWNDDYKCINIILQRYLHILSYNSVVIMTQCDKDMIEITKDEYDRELIKLL